MGTEKALMELEEQISAQGRCWAVFTAICANGPVYTAQDSSVNRGLQTYHSVEPWGPEECGLQCFSGTWHRQRCVRKTERMRDRVCI